MNLQARALMAAFHIAPHIPESLLRGAANIAALATWAARPNGVQQLETNLARINPAGTPTIRRGSRRALRHYFRYYIEALRLHTLTPAQIRARVICPAERRLAQPVTSGGSCVVALGHFGNWDLAGAWAGERIGLVTTVAEHLQPEELFEAFLRLRKTLGMHIIPLERDANVFGQLARAATTQTIIPLLADRDLSATGLPAHIAGHAARVAVGPAALAVRCRIPLFFVGVRHVKLRGMRRKIAGSPWGIHLDVRGPFTTTKRGVAGVRELTELWTAEMSDFLRRHPTHWHMLQPVFDADLDLARITAKQGAE